MFLDVFFNVYAKEFTFTILSEAEVIGGEVYKAFYSSSGGSEQDGTRRSDGAIPTLAIE